MTPRLLSTGLVLALVIGGVGSFRDLAILRDTAAENKEKDTAAIELLKAENKGLGIRRLQAASSPESAATSNETKNEPREQRIDALGFLTDLAGRGYFATPSPMNFLRTLATAPNNPNIKKASQPAYMIDGGGNLSPGFSDFFGLGSTEASELQAGLSSWNDAMAHAIEANTTMQRQPDGSVILTVRPVPDAAALREGFTALLQESLGPDRFRAFTTLNFSQRPEDPGPLPSTLTGNMDFFGEADATYTLRRTPNSLSVNYNIKGPGFSGGGGGSGGSTQSPEALREMLLKTYGPVMKLLPPDF